VVAPDDRLNRRAETCVHNAVQQCICVKRNTFFPLLITCQYFVYFKHEDQIVESYLQVTSLEFQH